MTDWTSGYVAEVSYTYGYYSELNPNRACLAFLNAGLVPPSAGVHCELGYGQGLSVNIHAAATGSIWHATDFNPSQAAFAQSLASASGANAYLTDEAFIDFCNRSDLPDFDSIGLHGIWSWISEENRFIIVDFIRRKLKVGGAVYISYNTLPGWANFAPIRHLMTEHAAVMGSEGSGIVNRVSGALEFAKKLIDTHPIFAKANPSVADRLQKVTEQNRHYLVHEYFNQDWHPMHFATMSKWLLPSKVNFACSANYLDHIAAINLTTEQQALLKEIPDLTFKESVRDFIVNQQFRRDYWIKGERKLSAVEQSEQLKKQRVVLISAKEYVPLKVSGAIGEAELTETVYSPLLNLMSDHKIRSIEQIVDELRPEKISLGQVIQMILVLIGAGHVASAQTDEQTKIAKQTSRKLNKELMNKARFSTDITFLASPITGGGISVNRFEQLFLLAINEGTSGMDEWAQFAWTVLASQDERLLKNGKPVETVEENYLELVRLANEFQNQRLPILKALQVA